MSKGLKIAVVLGCLILAVIVWNALSTRSRLESVAQEAAASSKQLGEQAASASKRASLIEAGAAKTDAAVTELELELELDRIDNELRLRDGAAKKDSVSRFKSVSTEELKRRQQELEAKLEAAGK